LTKIDVVAAERSHINHIAENMRDADVAEVAAMSGLSPFDALDGGLKVSTLCWTALVDDKPCLMFGVCPAPGSIIAPVGIPWLLGTPDIKKMRRKFIVECRDYTNIMLRHYPSLRNFVDVRNKTSIRWLKWLGFELGPEIEAGINGELFHPFYMRG